MNCFTKHDPGPCPVDDTPHTACVSPDYAAGGMVATFSGSSRHVVVGPLLRTGPPPPRPAPDPPPVTFTTKTYKRALHGRGRKTL